MDINSIPQAPAVYPTTDKTALNLIIKSGAYQKKFLGTVASIFYQKLRTSALNSGNDLNDYNQNFSMSILDLDFSRGLGQNPTGATYTETNVDANLSRKDYIIDFFRYASINITQEDIAWTPVSIGEIILRFLTQRYYYEIDRATVAELLNVAKNAVDFQYTPVNNVFTLNATENDPLNATTGNPILWKDIAEQRFVNNHLDISMGAKAIWINATAYNLLIKNGTTDTNSQFTRFLNAQDSSVSRNIMSFDGYPITRFADNEMIGGYTIDAQGNFSEDTTQGRISMVVWADTGRVYRPLVFKQMSIITPENNSLGLYSILRFKIFYGVVCPLYQSSTLVIFQNPAPSKEQINSGNLKIARIKQAGGNYKISSEDKGQNANYDFYQKKVEAYREQLEAEGKLLKNETVEEYLVRKNRLEAKDLIKSLPGVKTSVEITSIENQNKILTQLADNQAKLIAKNK